MEHDSDHASVGRDPLRIKVVSGVRCRFCDELFSLTQPGQKQVLVSEDGNQRKPKRRSNQIGDLVYRCPVCRIRGKVDTVDGMKMIEINVKPYSDAEIEVRLEKEMLISELADFGKETWAGWKP